MIDELFERAKNVFGMDVLNIEKGVYDEVVVFAEGEEMKRFLEGTYFCEICLEKKKGGDCIKLPRCGHVSCRVTTPHPNSSLLAPVFPFRFWRPFPPLDVETDYRNVWRIIMGCVLPRD